jgi:hypothetical protein
VALVLAVVLLPVVLYCLVRSLTAHRSADDAHHRAVDVWHVVLGLAMLAALIGLSQDAAVVVLLLAGAGVVWGVVSVEREVGAGAYARLAVGGAAMAVMTLPLATPAEAATPGRHDAGMTAMAGDLGPALLVVLLLGLGVSVVTAAVVAARRTAPALRRLDACCDLLMAGVMAVMLLVAV